MTACQQLAPEVGIAAACRSMEVSRATFYRRLCQAERPEVAAQPRRKPVRGLSDEERGKVVEILHQERFMDKAPALSMPPCLTKEPTFALRGRCTASWARKGRCGNDEISCDIRATVHRSFWPRARTRSGPGISVCRSKRRRR